MRASYNWLKELTGVDAPADEVAERLTAAGLAVDAVERHGEGLGGIVVAEVRASRPHPKRDKLTLVTVFDGAGEHEVVCGAPNVPEPGHRVLFARLGAHIPAGGFTIEERKVAGVLSRGMICSEAELDIGADAEGIFVFGSGDEGTPGQPVVDALGLRDAVLELDLTPNRPDCLGHVGVAREVALLFGGELQLPAAPSLETVADEVRTGEARVRVDIEDPLRCPRYGAALVTGVKVAPSPFRVRHRLHLLGVRSISNLVDATNLILLEWGHPIHGFDLARVRDGRIVVRLAREGETMATLDGVERTFTADDLLICDGRGPVAVAGVMGGESSEITNDTTAVLIECAYFDPRSVRRTARRLGMHTDASHRFERGVDPGAVVRVLARAADLLARMGGGQVHGRAVDALPQPIEPRRVRIRPDRTSLLLGSDVSASEIRRWLSGIGCEVAPVGAEGRDEIEAEVPTWRPDIAREVDLIEEVARLRGYDAIPTHVPRVRPSEQGTPPVIRFGQQARWLACAAGLHEVVSYAFVSRRELAAARVPTDAVALANPLSEERAVMRTSLLPGLASAAVRAQRRQMEAIRLFESGRTFHLDSGPLPEERSSLAWLLAGPRPHWIGPGEPVDFYDGKGVAEAVVRPLCGTGVEAVWDEAALEALPHLHPRRSAQLRVEGRVVGAVGELHPDVAEAIGIEGRPVFGELSLDALWQASEEIGPPQAVELPRFPAVTRDIAMVVRDDLSVATIVDVLRQSAGGLCESVELFDLYRGKPVPEGHKSVAFRLVYRDPEQTLTDERVDRAHAQVAATAESRFEATLR